MRWLPPITFGADELRWPLADASSLALETVLLSEGSVRLAALCAVLAGDPALTAWAAVHACIESPQRPTTIDDVAAWLAPRLARFFFDAHDDRSSAERPGGAAQNPYAERVAMAVVASELAASYAANDGGPAAQARLAAMVDAGIRLAEVWSGGARKSSASFGDVVGSECELRLRATGLLSAWLCNARAAASNAEVEFPPGWDRASVDRRLATMREVWQRDDPTTCERLPLLVARLRRLDELETEFQTALEREKLESLKQLAYGAGHEINNPLANISARAQTLIKEERDPERRRRLAAINSQAFRAHEMIADLMLFSRPPQLRPERLDLVALVDRVIHELLPEAKQRGASIERDCDMSMQNESGVRAVVDGVQLGVALRAMCLNSLEALGSGGSIVLTIRPRGISAGQEWIELVVADDGPGIKPEVRRHIFDPFYSGREAGRGLGFGLSKCWRIVNDHGGEIDVDSPTTGGAVFTIRLPAA